jgi:periplasmic protein TonB
MKRVLITTIALVFVLSVKAQTADTLKGLRADTLVFTVVEKGPEFPGGVDGFLRFIAKNVRYPADAREINKQGKELIQFIVEKDGSVSNVKVLRPLLPSMDKEAIRVVSSSPKWKPGMQHGQVVRVAYVVPISFTISTHVYINKN